MGSTSRGSKDGGAHVRPDRSGRPASRVRGGRARTNLPAPGRWRLPAAAPGTSRFTIGLVSDTHGLADPTLLRRLRGVDLILHAGDIGPGVLEALGAVAPVRAVAGNNDGPAVVTRFPDPVEVCAAGCRFLVTHRGGKPDRLDSDVDALVARHRPDVLVFGHSHQPGRAFMEGCLRVNPGSAGPRRFSLPRCAALLTVTPGALRLRYLDLDASRFPRR